MTRNNRRRLVVQTALAIALVSGAGSTLWAQAADAPERTFVDDFLLIESGYAGKIVALSKAIPGESYDWRPGDGVRSIREAFQHVMQTNFNVVQGAGNPLPEGVPEDFAATSDRDALIDLLERSFAAVRQLAQGFGAAAATDPLPGGTGNQTFGLSVLAHTEHSGEHLGQLIAYARSVGVVPPWSR